MKSFTVKKLKEDSNQVNHFFIAPSPTYRDLFSAVEAFNRLNNEIKNGIVYLDLIVLVGDQKNRFISIPINNYELDINLIQVIDYNEELQRFTKKSYSTMSEKIINLIHPISYRNEIINLRNKNGVETDSLKESVF